MAVVLSSREARPATTRRVSQERGVEGLGA